MPRKVITLLYTFIVLLLRFTATRRNLAYNATSLISPSMYISPNCGPFPITAATDGFMTYLETTGCSLYLYLFNSQTNGFLTISLPKGSTVRTMLYSSRETSKNRIVGLTVSVGNSYANSTKCFKSTTGLSSWITCNGGFGAVGSNIYMSNTSSPGYIEFFELMAFKE
jgi:hypothetical protein